MADLFSYRMKQVFTACVLAGTALIAFFVVFQEWGSREWTERKGVSVGNPNGESFITDARRKMDEEGSLSRPSLNFLLWNVHNYGVAGENGLISGGNSPKKEESIEALVAVLAEQRADVLALVEVNSRSALEDLRLRLREQGMEYPYDEFIRRDGQMRGLALLSRFPLAGKDSRLDVPLRDVKGLPPVGEQMSCMMRGILSVTVDCPGGLLNVGVVHLKSRVGEKAGREGLVRRAEADKVREWVTEKGRESPGMPLILCGDFNDTPDSPTVRSLAVEGGEGMSIRRLQARDSRGETWTQYYKEAETYSLFDYVFFASSTGARNKLSAVLVEGPLVGKASDHRPVRVKINKS